MTRPTGTLAVTALLAVAVVLGVAVIASASGGVRPPQAGTPVVEQGVTPPDEQTGPGTAASDESSFAAAPFDVTPEIKTAAVRFVESAGTWSPSASDDEVARFAAAGYAADLVDIARPLLDQEATTATTTVVYPQYGGLTGTTASVIVLARQDLRGGGGDREREVLLDVRLARQPDGEWRVSSTIDPPRPTYVAAQPGGPTELGGQVLSIRGVRLPEPAQDDIVQRRAGDPILAVVADLAQAWDLDVQVIVSGHPGTVFPTTRVSNHTVGRAVDIWAIDGRPVSTISRDDPVLVSFMAAAGAAGATEVGGPITPTGTGFFTDAVHQDHVHVGITPTKPSASAS